MRVVTLVIAMVLPPTLQAQYFGQNRVQYSTLNFDVIRTPHFEAHFPRGGDVAALDAVRMAERTYGRLSRTLNYQYVARQPLILFGSHSQFQQNNVVPIAEGTGGVTDAVRQRVLLPFTGSYAELEHVLAHELVHQFQYDIFARGQPGALDALIAINPPLWFMEGMAEYLSLDGPVPNTDMWLKDALLHGGLPTVHELTTDPTIFPYRYGHDLFRFIESRWGSGAVADVMHAVATYGVGPGLVRALGVGEDELSIGWSESVHARFPHLQDLVPQGTASLDHRATGARWHLSPALSPDGSKVVYLSEGNSLSIDLWVANIDATERRRLVRGAFSAEFESLRFISSGASWSPDGVNVAMAVKHGGRDDLVIVNTQSGAVVRRLPIPLDAVMNPTWSPDGSQIAFTGLMDGWSDLYSIGVSGGVPRRLTADRHADYHPSWSPDGRSIAFATDRTDQTNEENLDFGSLAVAVLDLTSGDVTLLPEMTDTNIDPEWSPTGDAIAFVSSRTGTANVFLYDVAKGTSRPITSVATGVSGITEHSPVISWARRADRLAYTVYQDGGYVVWTIEDPRAAPTVAPPSHTLTAGREPGRRDERRPTASESRSPAASIVTLDAPRDGPGPFRMISVRDLLDSTAAHLPDTVGYQFERYHATLRPDYVLQPTIGYARDNFGSGVFGGTVVSMSDLLNNHRLTLAGQLNGRLAEARVLAAYANQRRRTAWAVAYEQYPVFFFSGSQFESRDGDLVLNSRLTRFVFHQIGLNAWHPFSRFRRLEVGMRLAQVSRASLDFRQLINPDGFVVRDTDVLTTAQDGLRFMQPSLALVFDNTVSSFMGPLAGRRSRVEVAQSVGGWRYSQALADLRRYDRLNGSVVLASRLLFFGRFGRDSRQFPVFLGSTDLIRGYTAGSFRRAECIDEPEAGFPGCSHLDQLIGTRLAVANAEVRLPITRTSSGLGTLPLAIPPLEAALFFDVGLAWDDDSRVALERDSGEDPALVRRPLAAAGISLRSNFYGVFMLRADYANPLGRPRQGAFWTLSIGPTF